MSGLLDEAPASRSTSVQFSRRAARHRPADSAGGRVPQKLGVIKARQRLIEVSRLPRLGSSGLEKQKKCRPSATFSQPRITAPSNRMDGVDEQVCSQDQGLSLGRPRLRAD